MGSTTDKIKGAADQAIGKVKEGVGHVVGSDRLEAEGEVQQIKGKVESATGKAKEKVEDAADAVKRNV